MTGFVAALPRIVGKKYESVGGCHYESAAEARTYFFCRARFHHRRSRRIRASLSPGIPLSLHRSHPSFNRLTDSSLMDRALHSQVSQGTCVGRKDGETNHQDHRLALKHEGMFENLRCRGVFPTVAV